MKTRLTALMLLGTWLVGLTCGKVMAQSLRDGDGKARALKPFAVSFRGAAQETELLSGPPQTRGYRSGFVVLQKGQDMHEHTTGRHEEVLVILAGEGKAVVPGHEAIGLQEGVLLYIPPETRHGIVNTGSGPLKYIYLVAPVTS